MFKFLFIACLVATAVALPARQPTPEEQEEKAELERMQNESAQYSYNSLIDDQINDGKIERSETRDGTKVTGMYSYSDGFVRRTVNYVADENGYRVVNEETEDIGDGPKQNKQGYADVSGSMISPYRITVNKSNDEDHYKEALLSD